MWSIYTVNTTANRLQPKTPTLHLYFSRFIWLCMISLRYSIKQIATSMTFSTTSLALPILVTPVWYHQHWTSQFVLFLIAAHSYFKFKQWYYMPHFLQVSRNERAGASRIARDRQTGIRKVHNFKRTALLIIRLISPDHWDSHSPSSTKEIHIISNQLITWTMRSIALLYFFSPI